MVMAQAVLTQAKSMKSIIKMRWMQYTEDKGKISLENKPQQFPDAPIARKQGISNQIVGKRMVNQKATKALQINRSQITMQKMYILWNEKSHHRKMLQNAGKSKEN